MYFFKTPRIFKKLSPSLIWDNKEDKILLTFDDGPTEELTPFILDELKKYGVKALFFCVGENVKNHPELFNRILNEGHQVGNHTMNHLNAFDVSDDIYIKNILTASSYISSTVFRPPYGKISPSKIRKIKKHGFDIMMWSTLTGDFDYSISKEKCLNKTISSLQKNSIVVFHDNLKSKEKMKFVLSYLLKNKEKLDINF